MKRIRETLHILALAAGIVAFASVANSQISWVVYNVWSDDGSASAPTKSFVNDQDSGLFSVAADEVGVTAGGEHMLSAVEGSEDYVKVVNGLDNGEEARFRAFTTTLADLNSSATASSLIPAGCVVVNLSVRVTTLVTASGGGTTIDIGDGSDADRFGTGIAFAADTTTDNTDWTITSAPLYSSATDVVLAPDAGAFTAGAVRISGFCIDGVAPTG